MIVIDGTNYTRINHFNDTLKSATEVAASSSTDNYKIWIGTKPPSGVKYHCWWKIYDSTNIQAEINKAKEIKKQLDIDIVVISDIQTNANIPNSNILLDKNGVVRSFYNEIEIERFIIEMMEN